MKRIAMQKYGGISRGNGCSFGRNVIYYTKKEVYAMKMITAIVNKDDGADVCRALTEAGYMFTKISTTGGSQCGRLSPLRQHHPAYGHRR